MDEQHLITQTPLGIGRGARRARALLKQTLFFYIFSASHWNYVTTSLFIINPAATQPTQQNVAVRGGVRTETVPWRVSNNRAKTAGRRSGCNSWRIQFFFLQVRSEAGKSSPAGSPSRLPACWRNTVSENIRYGS